MTAIDSTASTLLVAIDISKQRRRRLTITNTLDDFRRLSASLMDYGLPVTTDSGKVVLDIPRDRKRVSGLLCMTDPVHA